MPRSPVSELPLTTSSHDWVAHIPIAVHVIKNEDDVYGFAFKFDNPDMQLVAKWNPNHTWCIKCEGLLEEVFGDICTEQTNES